MDDRRHDRERIERTGWPRKAAEAAIGKSGQRGTVPSLPSMQSTVEDYCHTFINRRGEKILIKALDIGMYARLLAMYLAYQPRNSFQGLPPIRDDVCVKWVWKMICTGVNLVALSRGDGIVGHVALFPIDHRQCEMLVVVTSLHQNLGTGTALVREAIPIAGRLGFKRIWVSMEEHNCRARHVCRKCGFVCPSWKDGGEVEMILDLDRILR
jgi:GNAT superfamily N-acetyltransferase